MDVWFKAPSAMLADYMRHLFPPEEEGGPLKVSLTSGMGRLLVAHLSVCQQRPPVPDGPDVLPLELSDSDSTRPLKGKWLTYSDADTAALGRALEATFDIDLEGYYRRGEALGMMKRDIVDGFIFSRGLAPESFDALHKRVYRRELRSLEERRRRLVRRLHYFNERIDGSGLHNKEDK